MRVQQQGFLLTTAIALIVIVAFLAVAVSHLSLDETTSSSDQLRTVQALYLAEAGLEKAKFALLGNDVAQHLRCHEISGNNAFTNVAMANGKVNVTTTAESTVLAHLSHNVDALTTTIPVNSTSGYAPQGQIMLDHERINYSGVTANTFTGAIRGVDGTTVANHVSGTAVGQNQCELIAQAGIPDLINAEGKRTLSAKVQLSDTWAVGDASGGELFIRWNGVTWSRVGPYSAIANKKLNSIHLLSHADGWAVGNNRTFAHWNGNTWTAGNAGNVANVHLNSVYCVASNDCWAVGQAQKNNDDDDDDDKKSKKGVTIARWLGGPAWLKAGPYNNVPKAHLRSVFCNSSNDCWAVGNQASGKANFIHWNGLTWTRVLPSFSNPNPHLFSVHCTNATNCWAVGDPSSGKTTFMHWNGVNWQYSYPLPGITGRRFNSVFCAANNDCWAVGNHQGNQAYIAHYNGNGWARINAGNLPKANLLSIHCASSQNCWTVGKASGSEVIGHWDGNSWSRTGPYAGIPNKNLNSVYVLAPAQQINFFWKEIFV